MAAEDFTDMMAAFAETIAKSLQAPREPSPARPGTFLGFPSKPGDPSLDEWLEQVEVYARQADLGEPVHARAMLDLLGGRAREEVLCHPKEIRVCLQSLVALLKSRFGPRETAASLYAAFHARVQASGEGLADYSCAIMRLHDRMVQAAATEAKGGGLTLLRDDALKEQFVRGVLNQSVHHELRRMALRRTDLTFLEMRAEALELLQEHGEPARAMRVRSTEVQQVDCFADQAQVAPQCPPQDPLLAQMLQSQQELQAQLTHLMAQQNHTAQHLQALSSSLAGGKPSSPGRWGPGPKQLTRGPHDSNCFHCQELGHFARDCPKKAAHFAGPPAPRSGN